MSTDLDPKLKELFALAKEDYPGKEFTSAVMSQVDRQSRRRMIAWISVGLLLAPGVWVLATLLQDAVLLLTQVLPSTLVDIDDRRLADALAPLNSVSSVLALGLVGLGLAYRKIFR